MARRENPEINAGSMADIAFLLLIFFLVTTTMDVDSGIPKKLAEKTDVKPPIVREKNIFQVDINRNNQLLVENEAMELKDLKDAAIKFIDNGGGIGNPMPGKEAGAACNYCKGAKDPESSDHPNKAVIAVQSDRGTDFGTYVSVQDELLKAYTELRNRFCEEKYGISFTELEEAFIAGARKDGALRIKVEDVKNSYPQIISDIDPTNVQ